MSSNTSGADAGPSASWSTTDLGLLVIRLMPAVVYLFHGSQKLFGVFGRKGIGEFAGYLGSKNVPLPVAGAWAAGLAEFLGGLALLTGVWMRPLAVPLIITMLVAAKVAHTGFDAQQGGWEYPITLAAVVLGLAITGPGRLTLPMFFRQQSVASAAAPARA